MRLASTKKIVELRKPSAWEVMAHKTDTFINLNTEYTIAGISFNGLSPKVLPLHVKDASVAKTDLEIASEIFKYNVERKHKSNAQEAAEELLVKSCSYKKLFYSNQNDLSDKQPSEEMISFKLQIDAAREATQKVLSKETFNNIARGIHKLPFNG